MKMPMGKFKGQPVADMTTTYLVWLVSNDHIRFKRWPLIQEALRVLRGRFDNLDAIVAELKVESPPPAYWKTPEQIEQRNAEKAEKLRQLEERRAEEKRKRREEYRARRDMGNAAAFLQERLGKRSEPAASVLIDASYYVAKARQEQADPNDVSDLL